MKATSASSTDSVRWSAKASAFARSPASPWPDTVSSCHSGPGTGAGAGAAASRTKWTFDPDQPNELTPARSTPEAFAGNGRAPGTGRTGPSTVTTEFGVLMCRLPGSVPCSSDSTVLISPAIPAAARVWPTFDFTAPT